MNLPSTYDNVHHHHGHRLPSSANIKIGACCPLEVIPDAVRRLPAAISGVCC